MDENSNTAEPNPRCPSCGQVDTGQSILTGEYPCPDCGMPTTHDRDALVEDLKSAGVTVELQKVDRAALGVTEGRIVHYQIESGSGIVKCRAAVITESWAHLDTSYQHGEVNLTVFTDWSNDSHVFGGRDPLVWKTSVPYHEPQAFGDRIPGTWHFPQADAKIGESDQPQIDTEVRLL